MEMNKETLNNKETFKIFFLLLSDTHCVYNRIDCVKTHVISWYVMKLKCLEMTITRSGTLQMLYA